jgi:hypothetical protein
MVPEGKGRPGAQDAAGARGPDGGGTPASTAPAGAAQRPEKGIGRHRAVGLATISAEYGVGAPPEVVFDALTDPHRLHRWLSRDVLNEPVGEDLTLVRSPWGTTTIRSERRPDDLCVLWSSADGGEGEGIVRVRDAGAGASTVAVDLRLSAEVTPAAVRLIIAVAAGDLRSEVAENFTAG